MGRQGVAAFVKRDAELEVQGAEDGFFGSWYLARVTGVNETTGVINLRYAELLKDDGTAETETLRDAGRLRPPLARWLAGYSKRPQPLAVYQAGDPIEVLHEEGWWEGYVEVTHDSYVTLKFETNPGEEMEISDPKRLRPAYDFDGRSFIPARHRRDLPGVRDARTMASPRSGAAAKAHGRAGGVSREGPGGARAFAPLPPFSSAAALYPPPLADSSMSSDEASRSDADVSPRGGVDATEAAGQRVLRAAAKAVAASAGEEEEEPHSKRRRTQAALQSGATGGLALQVVPPPRPRPDLEAAAAWAPCAPMPATPPPPPPADVAAAVAAACVRRTQVLGWRMAAMAASDAAGADTAAADAAFGALRRRLEGALVRVHPPAQSADYRLLHVTAVGVHERSYDCPPRRPGRAGTETIGLWLAGGPGPQSFRRLYRLVDVSDAEAPTPQEVAAYCATHFRPGEPLDLSRLHLLAAKAAEPLLAPP